jgi:filamentous hemagglutinin family protein
LNKTHRLIWNEARQDWIVAHEGAATRGKRSSTIKRLLGAVVAALVAQPAVAAGPAPSALPTGGQLVAGQAAISQAGNAMTVQQASDKAILNWQSFNIGSQASVRFQQPSSSAVALNRVVGADPSALYGSLTANGQVFLINPNGVLIGQGSRVDVGGLVASTLGIRNDDFLSGNYRFTRDGSAAGVTNQGDVTARYAALLGSQVTNEGVIAAPMGTVALASGEAVTLGITGRTLVSVQVDPATIDTLVANKRLIRADEGTVILAARSASQLLGRVVNTGTVEAQGLVNDGGTIRLIASSSIDQAGSLNADAGARGNGGHIAVIADLDNSDSRTTLSGTLSARGGSTAGNGGFLETSGSHLTIADSARIDASAPHGKSGTWLLDPYDFTISASSSNGDITGAALSSALANSSVAIATADTSVSCAPGSVTCRSGNASGNGDINVNDSVSWSANNKLTLSAWRNVNINAPITVGGAGGSLALEFAQSDVAGSFPTGAYIVTAPVNLVAGAGFSTKTGSDGIPVVYTVITDPTGLTNISGTLAGNFVLGSDVALPAVSWTPLGTMAAPFTGNFDGLGHKVTGLLHTNAGADTEVGLFGASTGLLQNVGVITAGGTGIEGSQNVGALVGYSNGSVINSYAKGFVTATGAGSVGAIGGLVGLSGGPIQGSYADVAVSALTGDQISGVPLGPSCPPTCPGGTGGIGGLAGVAATAVSSSYAKGSVKGLNAVGGLVGFSAAGIDSSYSTATVNNGVVGAANVGGFIGQVPDPASGTPLNFSSFWDTTTSGQGSTAQTAGDALGGNILGLGTAAMKTASTFTAANWGTLGTWELRNGQYPLLRQMLQPIFVIGDNITATYSGAAFAAFTSAISPATIPGSAYTGAVTYTPSTASPKNVGNYTFTTSGLNLTDPSDQQGYRMEFAGGALAITKANLALIGARLYDGTTVVAGSVLTALGAGGETFSVTGGGNASNLASKNASATPQALASLTGLSLGAALAGGGVTSNYNPLSTLGSLVGIDKAHLTVTANNQARLYGQANPNFTEVISGFVGGETLGTSGVTGAATAFGTSAATAATSVSASPVIIAASATGLSAVNYDFPTLVNGALTINKAHLTVTADNKTMAAAGAVPPLTTTVSGFANSETLATSGVTGSGAASTTATSGSPVGTVPIVAAQGTLAATNYDFPNLVNGSLQITVAATSTTSTSSTSSTANDPTSQKVIAAITTVTNTGTNANIGTKETNALTNTNRSNSPVSGGDNALGNSGGGSGTSTVSSSGNSSSTSDTDAPPPASIAAKTSNPTPKPGDHVPISTPSVGAGAAAMDPSKPATAALIPADGGADIPIPPPKITQNANGSIAVDVTVPPDTAPGVYLVTIVGTDSRGVSRTIIVPVVVRRNVRA